MGKQEAEPKLTTKLVPHNGYLVVERDLEMEKSLAGLFIATPGKPEIIWGEVLDVSSKAATVTRSSSGGAGEKTEQTHDFAPGQLVFFYRPSAVEVIHRGVAFWLIRGEDVMGHVDAVPEEAK